MRQNLRIDKLPEIPDYKKCMSDLEIRLSVLQRDILQHKIPVIIVFEGWTAAGKGNLINRLILRLDPRMFSVFALRVPTSEETFRPYLWRYWQRIPAKGIMHILDRSWFRPIIEKKVNGKLDATQWQHSIQEIRQFERQLVDDGTLVIKFFLHISRKKQKKRLKKLETHPEMVWRVSKKEWRENRDYPEYLQVFEELISETDTAVAPWHIINSHHPKKATLKICKIVAKQWEEAINNCSSLKQHIVDEKYPMPSVRQISRLATVDLSQKLERTEYNKLLKKYQNRLALLQHKLYQKRVPLVLAFEGWDAAGKGGNIKRLVQRLDPRGYDVVPIGAPNSVERQYHYLWRFWRAFPKAGHIAIFDRSWYGRVLVERVEGYCSETEWRRAYDEINEMEQQWVHFGAIVIKFWLHIDKETQLKRFRYREATPHKNYKITPEDWRNRERWDLYELAVEDMLARTDTNLAPWVVVEANSKLFARIKVLKTVVKAVEKHLKQLS
jgi:polyphosphate:AMP phosphotransferase